MRKIQNNYNKPNNTPNIKNLFHYKNISGILLTRGLWALFLQFLFTFCMRLKVYGSVKGLYKKYPKLIIISNHSSHLDGLAIFFTIPFSHWMDLYILAAKDYWFSNRFLCVFSKYFVGAIPIDRVDKKRDSVKQCISLLQNFKRLWIIMFPEGSRSINNTLRPFKQGVSIFSQKTNTPILFMYIKNGNKLWPKHSFPRLGKMYLHIGPVHKPASAEVLFKDYKEWVKTIKITKTKNN